MNKGKLEHNSAPLISKLIQPKILFILPAVILLMVIIAFPLLSALKISFQNYNIGMPGNRSFAGFKNYASMIKDVQFWSSLGVTIRFALSAVVLQSILGITLALCLFNLQKGNSSFITILLIPMSISPVAIGLIWRMLLHPDLGIINYVLDVIGIGGRAWLGNHSTALNTIILVDTWQWTPFMMIIFYSGLLSLPKEPYEAAILDGANSVQIFFYLTVPLTVPIIITAVLFRFIDAFKAYDLVYILTGGGPGTSTETLSYYIYRIAFTYLDLGRGTASSFIILFAMAVVTAFLSRNMINRNNKETTLL